MTETYNPLEDQVKRVLDWYLMLKEPYQSKAVRNLNSRDRETRKATSLHDAVNQFTWAESPEGHDYWKKIRESIRVTGYKSKYVLALGMAPEFFAYSPKQFMDEKYGIIHDVVFEFLKPVNMGTRLEIMVVSWSPNLNNIDLCCMFESGDSFSDTSPYVRVIKSKPSKSMGIVIRSDVRILVDIALGCALSEESPEIQEAIRKYIECNGEDVTTETRLNLTDTIF